MSNSIIKYKYTYDGPVIVNDKLNVIKWQCEVVARNEIQARIMFREEYRKQISKMLNKSCTSRIYLPGKITKVLTIM